MSKALSYFDTNVEINAVNSWWKLAFINPKFTCVVKTIVRLLLNVSCFGWHSCNCCGPGTKDSIEHILFECDGNVQCRYRYWKELSFICPSAMFDEMENMSQYRKCRYMLNCFNSPLITEWIDVYYGIGNFIHWSVKEYSVIM